MYRTINTLALIAVAAVLTSSSASAQWFGSSHWNDRSHSSHHSGAHLSNDWAHELHRPVVHVPNVDLLDSYADRLVTVATHLHDDAHALSQGYQHSASIERYVSRIERLQTHMHDILHQASSNRITGAVCVSHIRSDVRQVASLARRLDGELSHQHRDGVSSSDFQLISHMRQVIASEMNPLLGLMNAELTGSSHHAASVHRTVPVQARQVNRRPSISFRWGF